MQQGGAAVYDGNWSVKGLCGPSLSFPFLLSPLLFSPTICFLSLTLYSSSIYLCLSRSRSRYSITAMGVLIVCDQLISLAARLLIILKRFDIIRSPSWVQLPTL